MQLPFQRREFSEVISSMELSPTWPITTLATDFSPQATNMDMDTIATDTTTKLSEIMPATTQVTVIPTIKLTMNPTNITQNMKQPTEIRTIRPTEKNTATE